MRTVEEFVKIVEKEDEKYYDKLLDMSHKTLINNAWEIAKWQNIYGYMKGRIIPYLKNGKNMFEDFLTLEIDNPIATIYEYELGYDEAQWTTWDNLDLVVREMFVEIKITTKK